MCKNTNNFSPVKNWESQNGREHCRPDLVVVEGGNHQNDDFGDDHDHNEDGDDHDEDELQDLPLE